MGSDPESLTPSPVVPPARDPNQPSLVERAVGMAAALAALADEAWEHLEPWIPVLVEAAERAGQILTLRVADPAASNVNEALTDVETIASQLPYRILLIRRRIPQLIEQLEEASLRSYEDFADDLAVALSESISPELFERAMEAAFLKAVLSAKVRDGLPARGPRIL